MIRRMGGMRGICSTLLCGRKQGSSVGDLSVVNDVTSIICVPLDFFFPIPSLSATSSAHWIRLLALDAAGSALSRRVGVCVIVCVAVEADGRVDGR